jgi:hypothetical protein
MKVLQLFALGMVAVSISSCGLLGNALGGGPGFSGNVEGLVPTSTNYRLGILRFTTFGGAGQEQSETAAFATTIEINGGSGSYAGFLVPNIDLGADAQRFYKFIVFEDKTGDSKYDLDATNNNGEKDKLLVDSSNGKTASGNRFLVYSKADGTWTTGKPLKQGWNLVTDANNDTTTDLNLFRSDDLVTQGLGGITITY